MVTQHEQLKNNLSYLKLEEMNNHLDETIDFINSNGVSFTEGLIKLTNYQIDLRERNMINAMVKVGNFPYTKELKDFDFSYQENINKEQILDLETLRFFDSKENIIFLGSSGVGKTHLAHNMGISKYLNGYISLNDNLLISYAYSDDNKWGRWKTRVQSLLIN